MKKHSKLAMKIVLGFTILAVLLCVACTGIGYVQYRSYIQQQYNERAYEIAEVFLDYCSEETLIAYLRLSQAYEAGEAGEEDVEAVVQSEEYQEFLVQLNLLRENVNANDIFVGWLDMDMLYAYDEDNSEDWTPLNYVFDSYTDPELCYSFGDRSAFNAKYLEEAAAIVETGERSDSYFISDGIYGYNTTALLPVLDGDEVVGLIGVEIPMSTLQSATMDYTVHSILGVALVTVISIFIYMNYLYCSMVAPINLIAQEASRFVQEENKISDRLDKVHTKDEIQTLSETLLKMEIDINQYIENLTKVTAEKERIGAELNVATQIQADMLPSIFPAFPERNEYEIFASMNPAKEVGGDFYDFFLVDEDHLAMVIADVSGKGIPAALFMVIAKTLIKNEAQMGHSPKEVMESVNNQLCENNEAEMFVTVWLGILQLSTGKLTAVNAGHEYPMIKRAGGSFELLDDCHGFVMGVMEDMPHEEYELQLHAGDSIFVYTDGVPDATAADGEQFGRERTLEVLNRKPDAEPEELLKHVKEDLDSFVGEAEQFDDITMLGMTYRSPAGQPCVS
ncbi:MAG: PP2C family protein-serine/threonine phosphatase [Lachnospiraceae bacterium]|nr:PP2C family protein-serine/threonine phosphatase [Lachnospiraceae bacterium]